MTVARLGIVIAGLVLACASVHAQSDASAKNVPAKVVVNIEAQPLRGALRAFGEQTGLQVLFRSEDASIAGVTTQAVAGELSAQETLDRLLAKTGLKYEFVNTHTVRISSAARPASAIGARDGGDPGVSRLAQVEQGKDQNTSSVEKPDDSSDKKKKKDELEPYQVNTPEVLIVGSRVMNVDVKRTEDDVQPYYILDSKMIEQSGATNVEDFLNQRLTMNTNLLTNSQADGS